jgi:dihydrofolate reductase
MAMSLDGFVNDRNGDVSRLHPDLAALRKTEFLQEVIKNAGAVLMGRHAYDMAQGDFTGYEFQVPISVLTHHVPVKVAKGESGRFKFNFITYGIESAMEKAKLAAGEKDVTVIGRANTFQQCVNKGLFDEIQIGIAPVLLGDGLRLFENINAKPIELESIHVIESPGVTYLRFHVAK